MESNGRNSHRVQREMPAISNASNQNQDVGVVTANGNDTTFVNHALILWNQRRREWVGNRQNRRPRHTREPIISLSATYEDILSTNRPFPQPVPLQEMVEFLVDIWERLDADW